MRTRLAVILAICLGAVGCSSRAPDAAPTPDSALGRETIDGTAVLIHGRLPVRGSTASIEMFDRYFAPTILEAAPGARIKLALRNGGRILHNFSLPGRGIDQDVEPGDIRTADVVFPSEGRIAFYCSIHRNSDGMIGALAAQ